MLQRFTLSLCFVFLCAGPLRAQVQDAPARSEGDGPYNQLIIRGVTLINSTGAPPMGPVDIVVEKNKIKSIQQVGYPGVPIDPKRRPVAQGGRQGTQL